MATLNNPADLRDLVDTMGVEVRVGGKTVRGIVDDAYSQAEMGRSTVGTQVIVLQLRESDVRYTGISNSTAIEIDLNDDGQLIPFVTRTSERRIDGFRAFRCYETT